MGGQGSDGRKCAPVKIGPKDPDTIQQRKKCRQSEMVAKLYVV